MLFCISFIKICTGTSMYSLTYNFSVLPRPFSEGGTPCRFLVTPCPFQEAEMTPCPFLGDAQRRPVTFYLTPNVTLIQSWGTLVVTGKDDNCSGFSNAKFAIMSACRLSCLVTRERVLTKTKTPYSVSGLIDTGLV